MIAELLPPPGRTVRLETLRRTRLFLGLGVLGTLLEYTQRLMAVGAAASLQLPYFDGAPEATPTIAVLLWCLWLVNGALYLVGRAKPASAVGLTVVLAAVLLLDRQLYSNHLYLLTMLVPLVALADAGAHEGDAGGGGEDGVERRARLLPVRLVQALVVIVYAFSGLAKLNPGFLSGAALREYVEPLTLPIEAAAAASLAVIAAELALGPMLAIPRTRRWGRLAGVALHGGMASLHLSDPGVAMFGVVMVAAYPLFPVPDDLDATAETARATPRPEEPRAPG